MLLKIFVSTCSISVSVSCFATQAYRKFAEPVAFLSSVWRRWTAYEPFLPHCAVIQEPVPMRDRVAYSTVGCKLPYSSVGMTFHLFLFRNEMH